MAPEVMRGEVSSAQSAKSYLKIKIDGTDTVTPLKNNILHIIMEVWKIIFLAKYVICRFHVNLPGCTKKVD